MKPEDFHCYKVALLTGNPGYLDEKGMKIELNKLRREPLTGFPVISNHEDFMRHLEWFESLFDYKRVYYYPARGCGKSITLEKIEKLLKEIDI